MIQISAQLQPIRLRFAIALGTIDRALNPERAIGTDGSVSHRAWHGIERLKQGRGCRQVVGLDGVVCDLVHAGATRALARRALAAGLLGGESIAEIAARLGKTEQTWWCRPAPCPC